MIGELHIRLLLHNMTEIYTTWDRQNMYSTYWRLYINNNDGAELILPQGRYPLKKNRVHFIPAWIRFGLYNNRRIKHFYFHFDLVGLNNSIHQKVFNRPFTLRRPVDFDTISRSMSDLHSEAVILCRSKAIIYHYLTELLQELPANQLEELSQSFLAQSRFATTLQYIEHHLHQPLTNDVLATVSHMSGSHFACCFKMLLGQTPAQYVLQRRIAWAAQQLIFSQQSIDSIAEETGFANRFHFSRQFARCLGTPPALYRKNYRE